MNLENYHLYSYDKNKVSYLKALLPFVIIVHHLSHYGIAHIEFAKTWDKMAIASFFAMSGYGLIVSYRNKSDYLLGFVEKSFTKLYIPYLYALVLFVIYYICFDVSIVDIITNDICALVPASWFIFVLSLFYLFFYVVFKYCNFSIVYKALGVGLLVFFYYYIANYCDISPWRFLRTPAFCVGMFFGLFDAQICKKMKIHHCILGIIICVLGNRISGMQPIFSSILLFLIIYIVPSLPNCSFVNRLSSISLELYIFQYIPIYLIVEQSLITSPVVVILSVIICDIILASIMHTAIKRTVSKINNLNRHQYAEK